MARGGKRAGSGRPPGAPNKVTNEVRELAQQYTEAALAVLVQIATAGESEAARVSAANAILDRGHGKPTQPISGDEDGKPVPVEVIWRRAG